MREYFRCSTRESVRSRVVLPRPERLQQHVSSRQQADEHAIHDFLLADDDFSDFLAHPVELLGGELKGCVRLHG